MRCIFVSLLRNFNISSVLVHCVKSVIDLIKPTPAEKKKVAAAAKLFLQRLNSKLKDAQAVLGGSGAKGTWLSGNHDLDIFVLFNFKKYASRSAELSPLLEKSLKKAFPESIIQHVHGSRDYFQLAAEGFIHGFNIEVIPILAITKAEQAVNITDVSPLHTRWVRRQPPLIKDEILLAKQFCKANSCYGAESYIGGFSGYVLEILVSYYSSFEKLLRASLKWKKREVLDVENYYPKKDALFHLNQSKIRSPIIVIDPVDKNRNAAAALSEEKWLLFQKKAREYLKKPIPEFFQKKELNIQQWKQSLQQRSHCGVWLDLKLPEGKEDVVGVKLLKTLEFLRQELSPFGVVESNWRWDKTEKASLLFELKSAVRPAEEVRTGPPLALREAVASFKNKNKNTYVDKDRIMAKIKIARTSLKDNLSEVLKKEYLTEKIRTVERVFFVE